MLPATVDTTWLNDSGTVVRVNHSSFHGSNKSRFDKSRSACSGNAQTNGFRCKVKRTLSVSTAPTPSNGRNAWMNSRSTGLVELLTFTPDRLSCGKNQTAFNHTH